METLRKEILSRIKAITSIRALKLIKCILDGLEE